MVTTTRSDIPLQDLLLQIRACRHCEPTLPLGANPVVRAHAGASLVIIGQAPGTKVHASGVPWDDPSGDRLRQWLQLAPEQFYDESQVAIVPMGFCYPGRGKSGDLPPSPECAPLWHERLFSQLPQLELVLLVGAYAQQYYLAQTPVAEPAKKETLTARVGRWREFGPRHFPLPHPSPRNNLWLRRNPWFEAEVLPALQSRVRQALRL
jgi:uracil-DNA glycosylase